MRGSGELFGHPRGLAYLAFTEAWERFSYYGMQALLVLYMAGHVLRPERAATIAGYSQFNALLTEIYGPLSVQAQASAIFGLYTGLVYLAPIAGGVIADRLLGRSRTIIIGALIMAAGHFLMAFEASFLIALLCLAVGTGCFKGNIASQVGGLYADDDMRRAGAYQLFYIGISAGVIMAPLVCGTLGEVYGWHYGFGAAGVGMLVGLGIYLAGRRYYPGEPNRGERAAKQPLNPRERSAVLVLIALLPVLALAIAGNQQIFNAYLLWGQESYDFQLLGFRLPTSWLITLDAGASVGFLALTVAFWRLWAKRRREPDEITKMILGSGFTVLAFASLALAASSAPEGRISLLWAVAFHCLNSIAFANIAPVALSLYGRVAPARLSGTMIGVLYIHLFIANNLVGWLGGMLERMDAATFWLMHAGIATGSMALLLLFRWAFGSFLRAGRESPENGPVTLSAEPA